MDESRGGVGTLAHAHLKVAERVPVVKQGDGLDALLVEVADAEDVCDRVMILNHGRSVAEGKVSELGTSLEDFFLAKVGDVGSFNLAGFLKG